MEREEDSAIHWHGVRCHGELKGWLKSEAIARPILHAEYLPFLKSQVIKASLCLWLKSGAPLRARGEDASGWRSNDFTEQRDGAGSPGEGSRGARIRVAGWGIRARC